MKNEWENTYLVFVFEVIKRAKSNYDTHQILMVMMVGNVVLNYCAGSQIVCFLKAEEQI